MAQGRGRRERGKRRVTLKQSARKISFPQGRSLGELYTIGENGRTDFLCDATGSISVPAGKDLALYYSFNPMDGLGPLTNLEPNDLFSISFLGSDVTNQEMEHLKRLTGLAELDISCTAISDEGISNLSGLARLKRLNLSSTKISDDGLAHLSGLTSLEELVLDDTRVGDDGMKHIVGLKALKTLSLSFTQLTNRGLSRLKEMKGLERLRLNCTNIDDQGLSHVARLSTLKELWLRSTQVTYPGLVELTKWLCDCEIIR
jgi:hypothetical protein